MTESTTQDLLRHEIRDLFGTTVARRDDHDRVVQRAGDAERTATCEALAEHFVSGRLGRYELETRLGWAMGAVTEDELRELIADLPNVSWVGVVHVTSLPPRVREQRPSRRRSSPASFYRRGMQASEVSRAVTATRSIACSLGLTSDDAIVLNNSNKLALRLLPCDVLARVAPADQQVAQLEVGLAQRLAGVGSPVAALEPRVPPGVHERDGFVVTLWTYYEPTSRVITPADYAGALARLHAGMRMLEVSTPRFTDRVDSALRLVASRDLTPALPDGDRVLLSDTLRRLSRVVAERGDEQLLHGEPHPGNLLTTARGLLFIDLETSCRGPVEFDLAHAPDEVAEHYPGADHDLLRLCRILVLAMITTWRWDRDDQLPDGHRLGAEWLAQLRTAWGA